eukprot:m.1198591 g.1198591  ORF g.1198591 m.1198591 type:complete len:236 (-) comp24571_c0_seq17:3573-4280(-)
MDCYTEFLICLRQSTKCGSIKHLDLFSHGLITDRSTTSVLRNFPTLEILVLHPQRRAVAVDINILNLLPRLRVFEMDAPALQLTMFSQFTASTFASCKGSLRVLDLQLDNSFVWDAELVHQLENLECLSIGPCHMWDTETFDGLSALKNLQVLRVRRIDSRDSMGHFNNSLQHLVRLKYLAILDSPIEYLDCHIVRRLRLETVVLSGGSIRVLQLLWRATAQNTAPRHASLPGGG